MKVGDKVIITDNELLNQPWFPATEYQINLDRVRLFGHRIITAITPLWVRLDNTEFTYHPSSIKGI